MVTCGERGRSGFFCASYSSGESTVIALLCGVTEARDTLLKGRAISEKEVL